MKTQQLKYGVNAIITKDKNIPSLGCKRTEIEIFELNGADVQNNYQFKEGDVFHVVMINGKPVLRTDYV